jgi:hypothetical protein
VTVNGVARELFYGEMCVDNCFNLKCPSLSQLHSSEAASPPYGYGECVVTLANEIKTSQAFLSPVGTFGKLNSLTQELNPFAQRCLRRFFTGNFAFWTVHFVNICVKNQQIHQLFLQFINYVWYLLHVSALHCHPQGAFLVPSERRSIDEQ